MGHINEVKSPKTYRNYLSALKVFFRDFMKKGELICDFKFPKQTYKPKILPTKDAVLQFYNGLSSSRDKALFLLFASSGLRVSEVINLNRDDIDLTTRMIIPNFHTGRTKQSYITFYNNECEKVLIEYLNTHSDKRIFPIYRDRASRIFKNNSGRTGINIIPQTLRSIFAREASKAGISDRYIDAFCGRIPQSVLARHYSDYSPEVLKEIYDKANIKILE